MNTFVMVSIPSLLMVLAVCDGQVPPRFSRFFDARRECSALPDKGHCRSAVERWYFDARRGECVTFIYGGCAGNLNNFPDRLSCEQICLGKPGSPSRPFIPNTRTTALPSFPGVEGRGLPWEDQVPGVGNHRGPPSVVRMEAPASPFGERTPVQRPVEPTRGVPQSARQPEAGTSMILPQTTTPAMATTSGVQQQKTAGLAGQSMTTTPLPSLQKSIQTEEDTKQEEKRTREEEYDDKTADSFSFDVAPEAGTILGNQRIVEEPVEKIEAEIEEGDFDIDVEANFNVEDLKDDEISVDVEEKYGDGDDDDDDDDDDDGDDHDHDHDDDDGGGGDTEPEAQPGSQFTEMNESEEQREPLDASEQEPYPDGRDEETQDNTMEDNMGSPQDETQRDVEAPEEGTLEAEPEDEDAAEVDSPSETRERDEPSEVWPPIPWIRQRKNPRNEGEDQNTQRSPPIFGGFWRRSHNTAFIIARPRNPRRDIPMLRPPFPLREPQSPMRAESQERRIPQGIESKEPNREGRPSSENSKRNKVLTLLQVFLSPSRVGVQRPGMSWPSRPLPPPNMGFPRGYYVPRPGFIPGFYRQRTPSTWIYDRPVIDPRRERVPIPDFFYPRETTEDLNFACMHPLDVGFCPYRLSTPQVNWFFNKESGRCELFYFGGCGGNPNRFASAEECQATCLSTSPAPHTYTRKTEESSAGTTAFPPESAEEAELPGPDVTKKPQETNAQSDVVVNKEVDETKKQEEAPSRTQEVESVLASRLHLDGDAEVAMVIAVICLGGLALLLLVGFSFVCIWRRCKKRKPKKDTVIEAVLRAHLYNNLPKLDYVTAVPPLSPNV